MKWTFEKTNPIVIPTHGNRNVDMDFIMMFTMITSTRITMSFDRSMK